MLDVHWSDDRSVADLAGEDTDRWDDDGGATAGEHIEPLEDECGA